MSAKTNKARRKARTPVKSPVARPASKYLLRLFVAGATARSRQAVLRVRQLYQVELKNNCKLEVIDIYQQPGVASREQIIAAPTLVKQSPMPPKRIIGDLANRDRIIVGLNLVKKDAAAEGKHTAKEARKTQWIKL